MTVLGPARNYNGLSLSQDHVGAMSWYVIVEFSDHFQAYLNFFISYYVCLKCRGRVVTNVVRTCDPTPLLYIFGNKICLNYTLIFFLAVS